MEKICDAKELIAEHEGKISYVYDDGAVYPNGHASAGMPKKWSESTVGYATIGVGFVLDLTKRPDRDPVLAALENLPRAIWQTVPLLRQGKTMAEIAKDLADATTTELSLIHISEPTRRYAISYAVFC